MLQELGMPTKGEIREQGPAKPTLALQFDTESYYDQFALSEGVKRKAPAGAPFSPFRRGAKCW